MKIEIPLLAALLVLAIYAGGLIMIFAYIVHSFWPVAVQANPVLAQLQAVFSGPFHHLYYYGAG